MLLVVVPLLALLVLFLWKPGVAPPSTYDLLGPPANATEAEFRAYCIAHHSPIYTAEEWKQTGKAPFDLKPGDLYCEAP